MGASCHLCRARLTSAGPAAALAFKWPTLLAAGALLLHYPLRLSHTLHWAPDPARCLAPVCANLPALALHHHHCSCNDGAGALPGCDAAACCASGARSSRQTPAALLNCKSTVLSKAESTPEAKLLAVDLQTGAYQALIRAGSSRAARAADPRARGLTEAPWRPLAWAWPLCGALASGRESPGCGGCWSRRSGFGRSSSTQLGER